MTSTTTNQQLPAVLDYQATVDKLGLKQLWSTISLRAFQLVGRHELIRKKRAILSMDKGLGKTSTILSVFEDPQVNKGIKGFTVLIFTNEKGMESFRRDLKKFPDYNDGKIALIYGRQRSKRERKWKTLGPNVRYIVAVYDSFMADIGERMYKGEKSGGRIVPDWVTKPGVIDGIVCDEYHRKFRRHTSATFKVFAKLWKDTEYLFLMSGSAVSKGPEDLWAALHIVDAKMFSSYWKYVYTWCEIDSNGFGRTIIGPKLSVMPNWRRLVGQFLFHVTAEMVQNELPPISRGTLDYVMDDEQANLHNQLQQQLYAELPNGEFLFASNTLSALFKIRTALICPRALNPSLGYGGGIESIVADARDAELSRYAIFTPFRDPIPLLVEYLQSQGAKVFVLQGGIGLDDQNSRLAAANASLASATAENPTVVLSTIKYAESWEFPAARHGYMLGYEWDPEDNKQAEGRLRRLISPNPVFIQYVRAVGAYDEDLLSRLIEKANNRMAMFRTWGEARALLH